MLHGNVSPTMKNKFIITSLFLVLFGAGCVAKQVNTLPTQSSSSTSKESFHAQENWIPTASGKSYAFSCTPGSKAPKGYRFFNDELKKGGWQTLDDSDTQVCVRSSESTDEALIIALGPWCDVKRAIGCDHVGIFDAILGPQRSLQPIALIETSELYGTSVFNKIVFWNYSTLVYRANGTFPDGGCTEQVVKDTYAEQDRVVNISSQKDDRESVLQTCYLTSCSNKTLRCK